MQKRRTLSDVSVLDIKQRIARVRQMDLEALTLDQVRNRVGPVLDAYSTIPRRIVLTGVHRARKNPPNVTFTNVSELWCPPEQVVTRMGRLNDVHESVFYACNKGSGAAFEVNPVPGDVVTVVSFLSVQQPVQLTMAEVGLHRSPAPEIVALRAKGLLPQSHPGHRAMLGTEANQRKWKLIDDFLCDLLLTEVPAGEEVRYKATIALASILWSMPDIDGINYPSVATSLNCLNVCMKPIRARELFRADRFTMLQIGREVASALFEVRPIGLALAPDAAGSITWLTQFDPEVAIRAIA